MPHVLTWVVRIINEGTTALSSRGFRARLATVAAVATCSLLAVTKDARAADADCKAVQAAVTLQSKTPFRAMVSGTPTRRGSIPASKSEMIWIDNTLYLAMGGRWVGSPMPQERALVGVTGGNLPFGDCKRLPDARVSGQAATAYSATMQSGEHVQLFISSGSGQLLRETLDQQIMMVTVDFEYTNVRAPALGK